MSTELATHIVRVEWGDKKDVLHNIRQQVFVVEQSVPESEEWDGLDDQCTHFLALNSAGQALGCARLQPEGGQAKVGRMAVLKEHRGKGLGKQLLDAIVDYAPGQNMTRLYLHAQDHAEEFYRRFGFLAFGSRFVEAGINHVQMEMALPIPFESVTTEAEPRVREHKLLGAAAEPAAVQTPQLGAIAFSNEEEALNSLIQSLGAPRRRLIIYSAELDPVLLDHPDVISALSRFVRTSPSNDVRILLHSSQLAVSRGHRLVEFARRLSSKVTIRKVQKEYATEERCYFCWDQTGYFVLPNAQEYVGFAHDADLVLGKRITEQFDFLWQRSKPDPELRTLGL